MTMKRMAQQGWFVRLFEGEAGGAGGGAGAAGAGGAAAGGLIGAAHGGAPAPAPSPAPAGTPPAAPAAPAAGAAAPYWPDGLDQKFKGANERETLDRLATHLKGLPRAPEKPDAYTFQPGKGLEGLIDPKTDKVLPIWQQISHKHGLTQEQHAGVVNDLYAGLIEKGLMQAPVDINAEFTKLGGEAGDTATRIQKGQQRILALEQAIDGLATRKDISPDQAADLKAVVSNAGATIAMERLLSLLPSAQGPQNGGQPGGSSGAKTRADVEGMMQDPRYNYKSGKFDQQYFEQVNRLFEQLPT